MHLDGYCGTNGKLNNWQQVQGRPHPPNVSLASISGTCLPLIAMAIVLVVFYETKKLLRVATLSAYLLGGGVLKFTMKTLFGGQFFLLLGSFTLSPLA